MWVFFSIPLFFFLSLLFLRIIISFPFIVFFKNRNTQAPPFHRSLLPIHEPPVSTLVSETHIQSTCQDESMFRMQESKLAGPTLATLTGKRGSGGCIMSLSRIFFLILNSPSHSLCSFLYLHSFSLCLFLSPSFVLPSLFIPPIPTGSFLVFFIACPST